MKLPVTDFALLIFKTQSPVPEQSPDHPLNFQYEEAGVAFRVTLEPCT